MSASVLLEDRRCAPATASQEASCLLIEEMRERRARGEPAGVWDVLARHPGLTCDKQLLTDLACEEFSQRQAAGEQLDRAAFAAGFPGLGASLHELLETREFFNANAGLLAENEGLPRWPQPGELLNEFALLCELGRGSFARVFLAQQLDVADRLVVVKVSFEDATQEADALGSLCHPNIVPILSLHRNAQAGWTAVCMPYHGTATLADLLERLAAGGRLPRRADAILDAIAAARLVAEPVREGGGPHPLLRHGTYLEGALHLAAQLADAVAYVHEHRISHRDLKPANVLLTPNGRPLLLDFNLSCAEEAGDRDVGGTLPYMAPEQIRSLLREDEGAAVDARCDVYALGVILHQLLTGKHPLMPFPVGLTRRELGRWLVRQQRAGAGPTRKANPLLAPAIARLLDRCLADDPARRPSARELADALRHALTLPRRLASSVRAQRKPLLGAAAVALFALLFSLFGPSLGGPPQRRPPQAGADARAAAAHLQQGQEAFRQQRYVEAADHFSRVRELEGESAAVLLARGRARLRMGEIARAREDFLVADALSKDGKVKAALAACYHQSRFAKETNYPTAVYYYQEALRAGYQTGRVYNNLAYCLAMCGAKAEALAALNKAVDADPSLQAAYVNRLLLGLRVDNAPAPSARFFGPTYPVPHQLTLAEAHGDLKTSVRILRTRVLPDTRKALKLGRPSGELHLCAARACALAAHLGVDAKLADQGLLHVEKAIALGCHPAAVRHDPILAAGLGGVAGFQDIQHRHPADRADRRDAVRFLDPIED